MSAFSIAPADASDRPIVFVNSSYRTGSTWLWAKFRRAPTTIAYCEVFHEGLSDLDFKAAISTDYRSWTSKHPPAAPYWLEFLPLANPETGVRGYDRSMAFERFIPAEGIDGQLSAGEIHYLDGLIQNARDCGKIPVICDTRTLGRARALARQYRSKSILLHRNLFHQWASYSHQSLLGNNYFIDTLDTIVKSCRHDPFVRMLDDWFASRVASPYDEKMFQCFLLFHAYLYSQAFSAADLFVDITRISSDAELRASTEAKLGSLIDCSIDLSDARTEFEVSVVEAGSPAAFFDTAAQFWKLILRETRGKEAAEFGSGLLHDALTEWERHEFLVKGLRSVMVTKLEVAKKSLEDHQGNLQIASGERDTLKAQLSEVQDTRSELEAAIDELRGERATLASRLTEADETQAALQRQVSLLAAEREELAVRRIGSLEASVARAEERRRDALQAEAKLKNEVDAAMRQATSLKAALEQARSENAAWEKARALKLETATVSPFLQLPLLREMRRKRLLRRARNAMRNREWAAAAHDFHDALAIKSVTPLVWVEYGHALKESGSLQDASLAYRKVLLDIPNHPDMAHHLASVMQMIGQGPNRASGGYSVRQKNAIVRSFVNSHLSHPAPVLSAIGSALLERDERKQGQLISRDIRLACPARAD